MPDMNLDHKHHSTPIGFITIFQHEQRSRTGQKTGTSLDRTALQIENLKLPLWHRRRFIVACVFKSDLADDPPSTPQRLLYPFHEKSYESFFDLSDALRMTQENLRVLQLFQQQSADLHRQFLEGQ
jgi:hypothetical protein